MFEIHPRCCILSVGYFSSLLLSMLLFSQYHVQLFATQGLQHTRLPCPSLSPGVCSKSCPLSQSCHPTISSSVTLFTSCPQSSPASEPFPMSWLFASGSQSIGASAFCKFFCFLMFQMPKYTEHKTLSSTE